MRGGKPVSKLSWFVDREKLLGRGCSLIGVQFKPRPSAGLYPFVRLGDLCRIEKGASSSTKSEPGAFPLVVRGEEKLTSSTYHYEGEAVCVPVLSLAHGKGQIKRVHYIRGKFAVANLLAVLQPKDTTRLIAKYLFLALDKTKNDLAALMQGSVYVTLKLTDLENFEIPLPPVNVQLAVAKKYDALQNLIEEHNRRISKLQVDVDRAIDEIFGD